MAYSVLDDTALDGWRRRMQVMDPSLEAQRAVVVEEQARRSVGNPRRSREADRRVREMKLQPRSLRSCRGEAGHQLTERTIRKLEVHQDVIRRLDRDALPRQRTDTHWPRRCADRAHRLDAPDPSQQSRHQVQSVDAMIKDWPDVRIEDARVTGVLAPRRGAGVRVMANGER